MPVKEAEIVSEENTALAKEVKEFAKKNEIDVSTLDYSLSTLNPEDQEKALSIKNQLDEKVFSSLDGFGSGAFNQINNSSNNILSKVKNKDVANVVGVDLDVLLEKINSVSPKTLRKADPGKAIWGDFMGLARRKLFKLKNYYSSLDAQVDEIADKLRLSINELQQDNRAYEQLKERAKVTFEDLNIYIAAGDAKVRELDNTISQNNKLIASETTSNKLSLTTKGNELINYQTRLRKKVQDMKNLQFYLTYIQYPSIERLQSDNSLVIANIEDTIQSGLPVYKSNLTLILGALKTKNALEQTKAVRAGINNQITTAIQMINNNAEEIQEESMKTTIDTDVIIKAANDITVQFEKLAQNRNKYIAQFDAQAKALEEAREKIENHLISTGGFK